MGRGPSVCVIVPMVLLASANVSGGVVVTLSSDADTLVGEIVGSGIDVVPGSPTYTGAVNASGRFTGGLTSGIGMASGILLTSGNAALAQGGNSSDSSTGINGLPGDADLDAGLPGGTVSYDAAILEFDFTTTGGDLSFNYVFASDEYNEYVNTAYHDTFGLFLDGTNIAVVPGTDTAVSVNTVNGGGPAFGTDPTHPEFFHNNDRQDGGPFFDFAYDGFTDVFAAQAQGLAAGTHHIKIAIADTHDRLVDSAVLIQTGTFSVSPPVAPPATIPAPAALILGAIGVGIIGHFRRSRII